MPAKPTKTLIIKNTGQQKQLVPLLAFKNIVTNELISISKTGIIKTLFDRVHQSMVLVLSGPEQEDVDPVVIGGICFYQISQYRCVSIIYFAIEAAYQGQGYGNVLMSSFKKEMTMREHLTIATQADVYSLNFYFKNGFTEFPKKNKKLERQPFHEQLREMQEKGQTYKTNRQMYQNYQPWLEFIEDYYSSILVVYRVNPGSQILSNQEARKMVQLQKNDLIAKLDGEGYRKYKFHKKDMEQILVRHRENCEKQNGPIISSQIRKEVQTILQNTEKQIVQALTQTKQPIGVVIRHRLTLKLQQIALIKILKKHPSHWILNMQFIKLDDFYFNKIAKLMTLPQIEYKIAKDKYSSSVQLVAQLSHVLENLKLFLAVGSTYHQLCGQIQLYLRDYMDEICGGSFKVMDYVGGDGQKVE